jgi:hypothetical protein
MRGNRPITAERAESPFEIQSVGPDHNIHLFLRQPEPEVIEHPAHPRPGLFDRAMASILAFLIDGFAMCATGMYPELFCQADEPPRHDPDELLDDAPRSWRSDADVELHKVISFHRIRH